MYQVGQIRCVHKWGVCVLIYTISQLISWFCFGTLQDTGSVSNLKKLQTNGIACCGTN